MRKTKLGRRTSRKTIAYRLLKKKPVNEEHQSALKLLQRAVKKYDKAQQQVARSKALVTVAEQRARAAQLHVASRQSKTPMAGSKKISNAVTSAINKNKEYRITADAAGNFLDRMVKYITVLEKKEKDRQIAIAKFIKKWDSDYNRKHGIATPAEVNKQFAKT